MSRALVFGAGWIGSALAERLPGSVLARTDIADPRAVEAELERVRPDRVVNCAAKTGRPNVDSCEQDPVGTLRSNVLGAVVVADACRRKGIHFTHLSSGCVYTGDNDGRGYSEEDPPTFHGSLYARSKIAAEAALRPFEALQLRLRMPVSSVPHPRNLLTKLLDFASVVSVPNSITVLDDAWAPMLALIGRGETGVWNIVNEGAERHDEVLALYRDLVDPSVQVRLVSPEKLRERLRVGRSDCMLSTAKLRAAGLGLPDIAESLPRVLVAYGQRLSASASRG